MGLDNGKEPGTLILMKTRFASPSLAYLSKVRKAEDPMGCWGWDGSTRNGYGLFVWNYIHIYAHRYSYFLHYDFTQQGIPRNLVVRHLCDNPICSNPMHLQLGGRNDNLRDYYERKAFT